MSLKWSVILWFAVIEMGTAISQAQSTIGVEGIQDRQVLADRATFTVPIDSGFTYEINLNGESIPAGVPVTVTQPDYYELNIRREAAPPANNGEPPAERTVRFIIRDSQRGNSEWGLPPWTPLPAIPSAAGEWEGGHIEFLAPSAVPPGVDFPVVARVLDSEGRRMGVNGALQSAEHEELAISLRRGVGFAMIPGSPETPISLQGEIYGQSFACTVNVESVARWESISGALSESTTWPAGSRILIPADLTVPESMELRIETGSIVRLGAGVDIEVAGTLRVIGTAASPVLFLPADPASPWGGFLLRQSSARAELDFTMLTGGAGDSNWFSDHNGGESHRKEQALFFLSNQARGTLRDCAIVDLPGQAFHGEDAILSLTRCLVQRCITTGQFNGGSVQLENTALLEFPVDSREFTDEDNDAIYFTTGNHRFQNCLIGWAKDDGIDAGSGGAGTVTVDQCWIESCFHEGMAWSGSGRVATVTDSVALNCGQGIEAGFNSPEVQVSHSLSTQNLVGARFGDNYDWDYNGFLEVKNSFLLFNRRDVWGMTWDDFTPNLDQMDIATNWLTGADPDHPDNSSWPPPPDSNPLVPFVPTPGTSVGAGFAVPSPFVNADEIPDQGIPIRLSRMPTEVVTLDAIILTTETSENSPNPATVNFARGQSVAWLPLANPPAPEELVLISLENPVNAHLTGIHKLAVGGLPSTEESLIPVDAAWRYLDDGSDQGTAWREAEFDDSGWSSGQAELGYGDDDETTRIDGGPAGDRYATTYFRHHFNIKTPADYHRLRIDLRRDDGAAVYLNGREVMRSNLPDGEIAFDTFTGSGTSSESAFFVQSISPAALQPGENVIAVEVHQSNPGSSDISFALRLIGERHPNLHWRQIQGEILLYWDTPDFVLEEAASPAGPWNTTAESERFFSISPEGAKRFFRLRHSSF